MNQPAGGAPNARSVIWASGSMLQQNFFFGKIGAGKCTFILVLKQFHPSILSIFLVIFSHSHFNIYLAAAGRLQKVARKCDSPLERSKNIFLYRND